MTISITGDQIITAILYTLPAWLMGYWAGKRAERDKW